MRLAKLAKKGKKKGKRKGQKEDKTSVKVEKSAVSLKEIDDKLSSIDSIINDSYE